MNRDRSETPGGSPPPREGIGSQGNLDFSPLFTPITIRGLTLSNRFVMPGMQRGWCSYGHPPQHLADYYAARVRGGVQLILSECTAIDHPSATNAGKYARLAVDTLDEWRLCSDAIRAAGGHFFMQIGHDGALRDEAGEGYYSAYPILSPSGLRQAGDPHGQAATLNDLASIRDAFVEAAMMAKGIGAAGVEIHACHGYLLDQFLWSDTNLRNDIYGGPHLANRVRFPAEVVEAIRTEVGQDFVISFRFSQWKLNNYDARCIASVTDLKTMLQTLREAGVDVFHPSVRRFWQPEWHGSDLGLAGWTRQLSGAPVMAVGSVGLSVDMLDTFRGKEGSKSIEGNLAELLRRFNAGQFDLVCGGRTSIGDPDWVVKLRDGRLQDIRSFQLSDLSEEERIDAAAGAGGT